ncbi:hypothetical protein WDU94_009177 [Cyamophila willieti]
MEYLKKKRSNIKGRVTKLENKVNDSDLDKELAKTFLKTANSLEDGLILVENSILEICSEEEAEEYENYYDEVLLAIQHLTAKLNRIINSSDNSIQSVVQLPTIKLPTFNGEVDQWSSFKDMFEGLVHDNNALSSIQKFQYLKTSLVQDAAELIQHLQLRADNYIIAWNLLCDNYSNRYSTVNHHLKNIVEVEYSSSKQIHLIEAKFDDQVYMEWVKRVDKKHLPTLSNLYGFLDEMTLISERSESRLLDRKKSDVPTSSTLTCQFASQANYAAEEQEQSDMSAMLDGEDPGCDGDPHPETCELPAVKHLSQKEKDCEIHFAQNVSREPDGKYNMIKLPCESNVQELGESKARAVARLRTVEKGLNQCESKKQTYFAFMKEYSDLGHMSKVFNTIDWAEKDFFMDNLVSGADTVEEAVQLYRYLTDNWRKFHSQLHYLNDIKIIRNVVPFTCNEVHTLELHGFSDASESAYAACTYVRVLSHEKGVACNLLCAKSRVAPLKQVSLSRVEFCGAVLFAKLLYQVQESSRGKIDSCYAWTEPRKWKTFVANRVFQNHEIYDPNISYHVASEEIPSDVASRGISGVPTFVYAINVVA